MRPPKRPLQFLRWFCHEDYLDEIEGDLTEVFIKQSESSPRKAKWKFVWSVMMHLRPQFINVDIQNSTIMKSILSIKESPYVLLLFTTIALLLALAFRPIAEIDIQDITMFSFPLSSIVWGFPFLLLSSWMIYLVTNKFLYSITIIWIHVLITVITTLLIAIVLYIGINPTSYTNDRHELIGTTMQILSLLFVFGQLVYVVNILIGIFGRAKAQ
jgi:hypothetical protein